MRILFICHRFPYPPNRGGKIRPFNMIRWLSRNHEVTVASLARSAEEMEGGKGIAAYCHRYLGATISAPRAWLQAIACLASGKPSSLGYFYHPGLLESVRDLLQREEFELIWVHCSSAAQYVLNRGNGYRIMDFGDMDSEKWYQYARKKGFPWSLIYRLEGFKLRRYEKRLARAFDECTVTAAREKETLASYGLGVQITAIPNGVDLEFFHRSETEYDARTLVFMGRMDYYPNIDAVRYFCREILPLIRQQVPEVHFTIVGSSPGAAVKDLARMPGVSVTGTVPDVRPYVQSAAVSVAPLRVASGTQNKVLESMAMAVPVVASPLAAQGVDVVADEHLLVDDSPAGFAQKVLSLMQNPELRQEIAEAGRRRVEDRHSWSATLRIMEKLVVSRQAGAGRDTEPKH